MGGCETVSVAVTYRVRYQDFNRIGYEIRGEHSTHTESMLEIEQEA